MMVAGPAAGRHASRATCEFSEARTVGAKHERSHDAADAQLCEKRGTPARQGFYGIEKLEADRVASPQPDLVLKSMPAAR